MKYPQEEIELNVAIMYANLAKVREIIGQFPDLLQRRTSPRTSTWLADSSRPEQYEIAEYLVQMGCDVNDLPDTSSDSTPLTCAVGNQSVKTSELLLLHGADPNKGRPLIAAIANVADVEMSLMLVKLLIEKGVDVNKRFALYGDLEESFTALDIAPDGPIHDLLRKHGAKTTDELNSEEGIKAGNAPLQSQAGDCQEVIAFFERTVGPASKKSLIQIVPTGIPIAIHTIEPAGNRIHMTLFTNGLSTKPMNVPDGSEDYRYAEIYIDLPGDWKIRDVKDMKWAWPLHWLRKMAQYPHNADTWLGAPVTLIADEEPPKPLYKGCPFSALFLFADSSFKRSDGNTVQLYRMIPLYASERAYEIKQGLKKFMQAMDKHEVPTIVDMNRKPFA